MNSENNNPFNIGGIGDNSVRPPMGTIEATNNGTLSQNQLSGTNQEGMPLVNQQSNISSQTNPIQFSEPVSHNDQEYQSTFNSDSMISNKDTSSVMPEAPSMFNQPEEPNDKKNQVSKKKKNKKKLTIIILGLFIVSVLTLVLMLKFNFNNKQKNNTKTVSTAKKYNYSGFEFTMLDGYKYSIKDNTLVIKNSKLKETFYLKVLGQPFAEVTDEVFTKSLNDAGYQNNNIKKTIYDSKEIFLSEVTNDNQSAFIFVIPSSSNKYSFYGACINAAYKADYKLINDLITLLTDTKLKSEVSLSNNQLLISFALFKNITTTSNQNGNPIVNNDQNALSNQSIDEDATDDIDEDIIDEEEDVEEFDDIDEEI